MRNSIIVKIILCCLILLPLFVVGCSNSSSSVQSNLTAEEIHSLDSLKFDKDFAAELKTLTSQPVNIMGFSNKTGDNIPDHMLPRMIYFDVDFTFDMTQLETLKSLYEPKGYKIHLMNLDEGKTRIIASKL